MELWNLFVAFFRVGILGWGGGPSMIPLIESEVVDGYKWLTQEEFADAFALGNTLPGPIATKMAGFVGYKASGILGASISVLAIVLPTIVAMIGLMGVFYKFKDAPQVKGMLKAVRPAVFILLAKVAFDLHPAALIDYKTMLVAVVAFISIFVFNVNPAYVMVAALAIGYFIFV